jgi:hypothetical protein
VGEPVRGEQSAVAPSEDIGDIFDQELEAAFAGEQPAPAEQPAASPEAKPRTAADVPPAEPVQRPSAAQAAASAIKETIKGLDDVAKGLFELFGGGDPTLLGSGLGFDEKTYAKAKPLFIEGVKHFARAGRDIRDQA